MLTNSQQNPPESLYKLVEDTVYPGMWRVRSPNGALSDMFNIARAKALLRRMENRE